jgi:hypothetical protein
MNLDAKQMTDVSDDPREMDRLADRLDPHVNRAQILRRFEELFRTGTRPDPRPDGFLPGRLLATSTVGPLDAFALRLAQAWMPWRGKYFDASSSIGLNRFTQTPGTRAAFKVVFPGYTPVLSAADRIEAFPFRNRFGPGEIDPGVEVLKIDYDFEANPAFLIRRILDELVQVAPGRYLGRVLLRAGGRFRPMGFFSLRSQ